jgi:peroxiredoxin Q/BCP
MDVNDNSADFSLPDENGHKVSLRDFRGKNVILFFYPKADTPG